MHATVKVWDLLVRIFHWSLAASFAVAWLSADELDDLHQWAGCAAAALVGFRLVYGFAGPRYARFAQFLRGPRETASYARAAISKREDRYLGHNPLGAVMIVMLLAAMAALALTGWLMTTDAFWGVEWIEESHEVLANLMLAMVGLHVAGVLLSGYRHKENLVRAMVDGVKRAPGQGDVA